MNQITKDEENSKTTPPDEQIQELEWGTQLDEDSDSNASPVNSGMQEFLWFLRDIVIIIILALSIRTFIASPFQIKWQSMENSYHDGEYILVDRFSYIKTEKLSEYPYDTTVVDKLTKVFTVMYNNTLAHLPIHVWDPKRWDVVVITPHVDEQKQYYIKRVIGIPWDTIRIKEGKVFIKKPETTGTGEFIELKEEYLSETNKNGTYLPHGVTEDEFIIPEGKYWVMGDNRQNSADSRSCFRSCLVEKSTHFIKRSDILGKVMLDFGYIQIFKKDEETGSLKMQRPSIMYPARWFDHPKDWTYSELEWK